MAKKYNVFVTLETDVMIEVTAMRATDAIEVAKSEAIDMFYKLPMHRRVMRVKDVDWERADEACDDGLPQK